MPASASRSRPTGSGYTWAENSRENQLTPWSNDPVSDPPGEAIYVRDEETGELWTPDRPADPRRRHLCRPPRLRLQPLRARGARHRARPAAIRAARRSGQDFAPDPRRNRSDRPRRLSVTAYAEWVLGTSRGASAPFVITEIDADTGALLARNPWSTAFAGRVAFADLGGRQTAWTADRTEFLGRDGRLDAPGGAARRQARSVGATGAGLDPCAALQTRRRARRRARRVEVGVPAGPRRPRREAARR